MVASAGATASLPDGGRFVALDSLRGIAALGVVAFHVFGAGPLFSNPLIRAGWLWVDFFFVLSGFVIAASYGARLARGFSATRFMLLRVGRLYPLHLAVLAVYLVQEAAGLALQPGGSGARLAFTGERSPELLGATLLLVQAFVVPASGWNGPSWSISIELWLYLAAALLWRAVGPRAWSVALVVALAAGLGAALAPSLPTPATLALRGLAGFGLGIACWRLHGRLPPLRGHAATALEGASLAAILAVLWSGATGRWGLPLAALTFAAAVIVFAGERGGFSGLLRRRGPVLLGTISYSLYMVHALVIARLAEGLDLVGLGGLVLVGGAPAGRSLATGLAADLVALALLLACTGLAWCSWRWIEAPSRDWSRRLARRMNAGAEEAAAPTI